MAKKSKNDFDGKMAMAWLLRARVPEPPTVLEPPTVEPPTVLEPPTFEPPTVLEPPTEPDPINAL